MLRDSPLVQHNKKKLHSFSTFVSSDGLAGARNKRRSSKHVSHQSRR
jgi:hypothetical protein